VTIEVGQRKRKEEEESFVIHLIPLCYTRVYALAKQGSSTTAAMPSVLLLLVCFSDRVSH
jgi:hypothetical protein